MATILVIDDDLDLQQMLRLMLQRGGYKVVTTGDGPDGLAKFDQYDGALWQSVYRDGQTVIYKVLP